MAAHRMALLLVVLAAAPARADAPAPPRAVDAGAAAEQARSRAQPIFARGLEMLRQQRWADGLDAFTEAYSILPSPILRFNIGYCQRALGQYVAALETLRRFLAEPATGVAATRRTEAEGYIKELEARISRLRVSLPPALRAGTDVATDVTIDGRPSPVAADGAIAVSLDPGRHTVQARRPGFAPRFEDRDLRPGEETIVEITLEPLPARLHVGSNVLHASVAVDGKNVGVAPWNAEVSAGRHRVEVSAPGYFSHQSELNLEPGGAARVTADLIEVPARPTPVYRRWWFWASVGAAVAGATTLTYFLARPAPQPPPYEGGSLGWVVGGP